MKKTSVILTFFIFCLTFAVGNFFVATPAAAALELVRSADTGTIYYIDGHGSRHPFPNITTYHSWYGDDFSKVVTIDNATLAVYPLGKNITIRQGTALVKVATAPAVYAVEQGGVLRQLQDEEIAETLYGKNWTKRVVDVPDVFFQNYTLGEPLTADYLVPDGTLFQDAATKKYFYKNNKILRPFASTAAIAENHLQLSDAIVSSRSITQRDKPIAGFDKTVFDPVAAPLTDRRDCENKKLKAAVIFVNKSDYTAAELNKVTLIKNKISDQFAWATYAMSQIDLSYPVVTISDNGYILREADNGATEVKNELIDTFYENNADDFDFIFVWTNFKVPADDTNELAHFIPVTSRLEGIGKPLLDRSEVYGSTGKLKGVIMMGNINTYSPETSAGMDTAMNIATHELLHNWAAYVTFATPDGKTSTDLLRPDDLDHWNYYDGFVSPLGGSGWIDNGDGTFSSALAAMPNPDLRHYSQLDLYLMGLIPSQVMSPIMYVKPKTPGLIGNLIAGTPQFVTIDQIIGANGKVQCSLD